MPDGDDPITAIFSPPKVKTPKPSSVDPEEEARKRREEALKKSKRGRRGLLATGATGLPDDLAASGPALVPTVSKLGE